MYPVRPSLPASRNRLLAALPPESLARLTPLFEATDLSFRETLHEVGARLTRVHFPESGWISMLAPLEDGDMAEVGLIGNEGMVGLPLLLGTECDNLEAMVQGQGTALTLGADAFRRAVKDDPALRAVLLRYVQAHLIQVSRTAVCNGHHLVEQRLARWLLMSHDRAAGDDFAMTHEFLGMMLGVRRAGISVAAGALQKAGLIRYDRGRIAITDRPGLENACCECYSVVRHASERLFATDAATPDSGHN